MVPIGFISLSAFAEHKHRPQQIKRENYVDRVIGVCVAVHLKTWPCNKLIEMKTMNDGKHKENYWLIKSPIFKRFSQFFFLEKKRERGRKNSRAPCERWPRKKSRWTVGKMVPGSVRILARSEKKQRTRRNRKLINKISRWAWQWWMWTHFPPMMNSKCFGIRWKEIFIQFIILSWE